MVFRSSGSKPISPTSNSMSFRPPSSISSAFTSHSAISLMRLSARMYALRCASVRLETITQGTSVMPSARAAITRPWPAMMLLSKSTRIGVTKPNSRRLPRILLICSGVWIFALLAYGTKSSIGSSTSCSAATLTVWLSATGAGLTPPLPTVPAGVAFFFAIKTFLSVSATLCRRAGRWLTGAPQERKVSGGMASHPAEGRIYVQRITQPCKQGRAKNRERRCQHKAG